MRQLSPLLTRTTLRAASRPTIRASTHSSWRHVARRAYASEGQHDSHDSGSDLPWAIGSAAVFFPSAYYLWQQAPEKSSHSHDEEHGEEEHEEGDNEEVGEDDSSAPKEDEKSSDEGEAADSASPQSASEEDDSKSEEESGSDSEAKPESESGSENANTTPETSDDEEEESDDGETGHTQIDEGQSGLKKPKSKLDKRRPSSSEVSKSQHPYMADEGKSTKGEGITETAKLSGTVDPYRKAR